MSRQLRRPCRRCKWLVRTVMAVRAIRRDNLALLTSYGMQTWDILTALASLHDLYREVFVPASSCEEFEHTAAYLADQFRLKPSLTRYVPVWFDKNKISSREALFLRDEAMVGAADRIVPVSVKKNGNMATLLRRYPEKEYIDAFLMEYLPSKQIITYTINEHEISKDIRSLGETCLFHWTRTVDSAWPDETLLDYYRAVIYRDRYPRTAYDSLLHILERKKIFATSRNMPDKFPAVSFTGLRPENLLPLMRWRSRYRQMSFEPYGIGIDRQYAIDKGVVPVIYYDKKDRAAIAAEDRWRSQSQGEITDWRREKEYRFAGDFDLSEIPLEKLLAVCRFPDEAAVMRSVTGIKTISFVRE
ncbi:MAG: hypothetical protein ACOYVF_13670 [Candidatus Zixiibacteriota bacterium]